MFRKWFFYVHQMIFIFSKWFSYVQSTIWDLSLRNQVYWTKIIYIQQTKFRCNKTFIQKHSAERKIRPLNSDGFTVCHTVSLPLSRSHGRFFISHGFTNFKWIFSQTRSFVRKQTRQPSNSIRQHKPLPKKYLSIVLYIQKN